MPYGFYMVEVEGTIGIFRDGFGWRLSHVVLQYQKRPLADSDDGSVMRDALTLDARIYSHQPIILILHAQPYTFPAQEYKRNAVLISMVDWWITGRMRSQAN